MLIELNQNTFPFLTRNSNIFSINFETLPGLLRLCTQNTFYRIDPDPVMEVSLYKYIQTNSLISSLQHFILFSPSARSTCLQAFWPLSWLSLPRTLSEYLWIISSAIFGYPVKSRHGRMFLILFCVSICTSLSSGVQVL